MVAIFETFLGSRWGRAAVDAGFSVYARRRIRALDAIDVGEVQRRTLLRLVRTARTTRFGRDHGFAGIRTIADFQARVPLRNYEAYVRDYLGGGDCDNVVWPGKPPYLALSSGTSSGTTKAIPISRAMLASNQKAALTSLAWFRSAKTNVPLFHGRLFFLGGSTDLRPSFPNSKDTSLAGDLSGIVTREVSALLRPFAFPPADVALLADWDEKLDRMARESLRQRITMISGVPSWLLVLFDRLRHITRKRLKGEIWPDLRLVIHGGTAFEPYRSLFREIIGSEDVSFLETYPASEGFIAAEDPRHGQLRLIPDHGIFFEFVPVAELDSARPTRHTAAEVVPGVQYAVVLTTCAGLWSYVIGDTVCFEKTTPPLLRFTGRTSYFLSAFGEHLIGEEIDLAIAKAARQTGATIADFHVGPVFPQVAAGPGHHRYLVEFVNPPSDVTTFEKILDETLCRVNDDYQAHRALDLTMRVPEVIRVLPGGFAAWMKSKGKLGGQNKVPRMDNGGRLSAEMFAWLSAEGLLSPFCRPETRLRLQVVI